MPRTTESGYKNSWPSQGGRPWPRAGLGLGALWARRAQYLLPSHAPNSSGAAKSIPAVAMLHPAIPKTGQEAFPTAPESPAEHTQGTGGEGATGKAAPNRALVFGELPD